MYIITIDGPASSGKGTVASIIANKLGFHYLESGAIYRIVGLIVKRNGLKKTDIGNIITLIDKVKLEFINKKVMLDNKDVTDLIRNEEVGMLASNISSIPDIRNKLLDFQRSFAKEPGLVTDGRDMGSIVFPNARLKVFLTASPEIRAKRRFSQLSLNPEVTYEAILKDIIIRDQQDSQRLVAPLIYDKSFLVLDNTNLSIDEIVAEIIRNMSPLPHF